MTDKKTGALKLALEALERVNNTTLALKAMVPECREFAAIAQDLDCVIPAIREALMSVPDGAHASTEREQPVQQGCMRCNTPKKCALYGCSPLTWPAELAIKAAHGITGEQK